MGQYKNRCHFWKNSLILFIVILLYPLRSAPAVKIRTETLDNLYRVSPQVYRSEQPSGAAFQFLKSLGIKSVLNLREYFDDCDETEGTGLILYHYPLATGKVKEAQVVEILNIIKRAEKPVLIHCLHGSDRTGVVCAAYRILFEQWTKEDAIREFTEGPFGHHRRIFKNLPALIRKMDIEKAREKLFSVPAENISTAAGEQKN